MTPSERKDRLSQAEKQAVAKRQSAYKNIFDPKHPAAQIILEDLAKFCRANETTFLPDVRASDVLVGRREVWLRIQQHLNLTDKEAWALYTGVAIRPDITKSLVTLSEEEPE